MLNKVNSGLFYTQDELELFGTVVHVNVRYHIIIDS
mgnify:CR=1 FL=1